MVLPMGRMAAAALLALLLSSWFITPASGYQEVLEQLVHRRGKPDAKSGGNGRGLFILGRPKRTVKTEVGEIRVISGHRWKGDPSPMLIAFVHLEPNTLSVPQYVDANIILFVRTGKVKVGWIHKDEVVERKLKRGDISVIPAGSAFYIVNTREEEKSHLICSADTSQSLGYTSFQSFFVGGGINPTSVLSGFDAQTLATALNITIEDLSTIMKRQKSGAIISYRDHHSADQAQKREMDMDDDDDDEEEEEEEEEEEKWTLRSFLKYLMGETGEGKEGEKMQHSHHAPHAYNLYDADASYENDYGWSTAVDEHDYSPLKSSGIGVYMVNLTSGSMLAPHFNPVATEYGVVLRGSGRIQVAFPNGSNAMNAEVSEGDVFWIPRFFPFCQIASAEGPLEFFGFTTSSRRNHPQFLAGASSVLRSMAGPELAAAFGVSQERLSRLVKAQSESVILPSWHRHHQQQQQEEEEEEMKKPEREKKVEDVLLIKRGFFV